VARSAPFPVTSRDSDAAVLEKLAAGLPIVAYDVPGPRQLLAPLGSGLLTVPGDVDAFAGKLVDLLTEQPESYGLRALACREVASAYTWDAVAPLTLDLYRAAQEGVA
jgi:glycosyltransferase involved in cell wall biosynthesis